MPDPSWFAHLWARLVAWLSVDPTDRGWSENDPGSNSNALGSDPEADSHLFELGSGLDPQVQASLHALAKQEQRQVSELAHELLQRGLAERQAGALAWQRWHELTPRQQDVGALVCLGLTNMEIAARLQISPETVKTHVSNVLQRCGLHRRADLKRYFAGWDFSDWL